MLASWELTCWRDAVRWILCLSVSVIYSYFSFRSSLFVLAAVRNRLWNNGGFFFLVWAVHYLPFFVMNRQLFVHHYLPSHLASALIAGVILSFVLSDTVNYPISVRGAKIRNPKPFQYADIGIKGPVIVAVFSLFLFFMFVYLAPLTYGTPGYAYFFRDQMMILTSAIRLTGEQVNSKRLLSTWTLHFAAKITHDV